METHQIPYTMTKNEIIKFTREVYSSEKRNEFYNSEKRSEDKQKIFRNPGR